MDAPPVLPDHAVAVYGHASRIWQRYLGWRRFIDLGLACLRRVGPALETDERRVVVTNTRAPYAPIGRADANRVTSEFDPVVLPGIDRLIGLCPVGGDLAVAVGVHDARAPSLRGGVVVGLVELQRVDPADGIVLAEDERVVFVELVMVCGKAAVDRRELLRIRVIQFDLPCARARHREVLGELVRRPVLAERRLLLWSASSCRDPHASFAVHRHAAGVGLPLPDLLVPPRRRAGSVGIEHRAARRNLDLRRLVLPRIEHRKNVGRLDGSVDQPVRVQRWRPLVRASGIAPSAGRQGPVPHRDHEVALETGGTRRRFGIGAGGDPIGPIGERLALRPETLEDAAHVCAVGPHHHAVIPGIESRGK